MRRPEFIARQSRCPSGFLGRVIGRIMSFETATANDEALRMLGLRPADRVLEVGFGHGRTIERAAMMVPDGFAAGIDTSEEMVRMAMRRCSRLIGSGRVQLAVGDSANIPYSTGFFDKAFAVHTIYFWVDPTRHLRELRRVLRDGGRLVLGFRPKEDAMAADFPDGVYTFYAPDQVSLILQQAGFEGVQVVPPGNPRDGLALAIAER
jgi:ubiquinone/menaquinone biosynthesis C-methylase UbiE